ncbi:MAG: hypothetical protein IT330_04950, partial [Anaerolineae bacterium]|nr:hypothetical protein [Anaerolineae bacterium]
IGGATTAVEPRTARLVAEGVLAVLRGEHPQNVANPEVWERDAVHAPGPHPALPRAAGEGGPPGTGGGRL